MGGEWGGTRGRRSHELARWVGKVATVLLLCELVGEDLPEVIVYPAT